MSTRHHDVTCRRCAVGYRDTHYHCCICRRVFRSASAYETHQQAAESWDPQIVPTDAKLARLGLVRNPADVWMRQGSYSRQDAADELADARAEHAAADELETVPSRHATHRTTRRSA